MNIKPNIRHFFVFEILLALGLPLGVTAVVASTSVVAPTSPATAVAALPSVVLEHPAYKSFFNEIPSATLYAEGSLSPARRFFAFDGNGMLIVVLDLNKQTNRWEVAFVHQIRGGGISRLTLFHEDNQFAAVWQVLIGSDNWKTISLRADDQSAGFEVKEYPKKYASYFWDVTAGNIVGIGTNYGPDIALDSPEYRIIIGSLDGQRLVPVGNIAHVRLSVPPLLKQYDATTYRL